MSTNTDKREKQQYIYCMVRFSSERCALSYLTEDESVQAGDFVKVPFGKGNEERVGLVMRVICCTSEDAPYPPEKTKHILAKTARPEDWDVPKQKKPRARAESPDRNVPEEVQAGNVSEESQAGNAPKEAAAGSQVKQAPSGSRKTKRIGGRGIALALVAMLTVCIAAIQLDERADRTQPASPETSYAEAERREDIEEEIFEQVLKEHYSGEMPIEGMPMRALQYTSLGEPDEKILCRDYDKMDVNHKLVTVRWYGKDGSLLASGLCFQLKNEKELTLHSFTYFDPKDVIDTDAEDNQGQTIPWEGLREDYDDPEDLWEENQNDYDDEDEAWDEWYDDGDEPYED